MNKSVSRNTERILSTYPQFPNISSVNTNLSSSSKRLARLNANQAKPILHSWSNGVLLSELVANLLLDEKNLVKEVEQYDRYGRLIPHPKLLLAGTEPVVKSKAQAIHNIQQSIHFLKQIPNFPIVDFTAEELYVDKGLFMSLLRIIQKAFKLPYSVSSSVEEVLASIKHRRLLVQRQPRVRLPAIGFRSHSAPPVLFMDAIHTVSKEEGFPRGKFRSRSISSIGNVIDREKGKEPSRFVQTPFPLESKSGRNTSPSTSRSDTYSRRVSQRFVSPEPETRRNIPQPTPPSPGRFNAFADGVAKEKNRMAMKQVSITQTTTALDKDGGMSVHNQRSEKRTPSTPTGRLDEHTADFKRRTGRPSTPTKMTLRHPEKSDGSMTSDTINKIQKVRALESRRERLLAQQRDRSVRRRSLLTEEEKEHFARAEENVMNSKSGHVSFATNVKRSNQAVGSSPTCPSSSSSSSDHRQAVHRITSTSVSPNDWPVSQLSGEELASLKKQLLPPVTMAQMTAIKQWLQNSCQLPILDGEGGYYSYQELRTVNASHFPTPSEGNKNIGNNNSMVTTPPPLPLPQDRLRNGIFWCLLFHVLEPEVSQHTKLLQNTVYKHCLSRNRYSAPYRIKEGSSVDVGGVGEVSGINTIEKATSIISKVFWLWRIKHCPPLSLTYLGQIDEVIKCNKDLIWGLLYEIFQLYGSQTIKTTIRTNHLGIPDQLGNVDISHAFPFGNTKALPVNYRPYGNSSHSTTSKIASGGMRKLPYSALQRRSLDLSLVHWLGDIGVLEQVLGTWNSFPTSLNTLESYIKDGTLLCHMVHLVFKLPLSPSQIITHPHTYSQCISNLIKAIKTLSCCHSFPPRFLYSGVEEDIARGHWDVIYGLFEDLHLFYDFWQNFYSCGSGEGGKQSAQNVNLKYPGEIYPYYGNTNAHLTNNPNVLNFVDNNMEDNDNRDILNTVQSNNLRSGAATKGLSNNPMFQPTLDLRASYELEQDNDDVSFLFKKPDKEELFPTNQPAASIIPAFSLRNNSVENGGQAKVLQSSKYPSVTAMTALDPALQFLGLHEDIRHDIRSTPFHSASRATSASIEGIKSGRTSVDSSLDALAMRNHDDQDSVIVRESVQSIPHVPTLTPIPPKIESIVEKNEECTKYGTTVETPEASQLIILLQSITPWLTDLVGYPVMSTSDMLSEKLNHLGSFFQDGVNLARLLQKITRISLPAIELKPKTTGQKTQNIRKCMDLLSQSNKRIPSRILNCEEAILQGEGIPLLRLLIHIKRAFPLYKIKQ